MRRSTILFVVALICLCAGTLLGGERVRTRTVVRGGNWGGYSVAPLVSYGSSGTYGVPVLVRRQVLRERVSYGSTGRRPLRRVLYGYGSVGG